MCNTRTLSETRNAPETRRISAQITTRDVREDDGGEEDLETSLIDAVIVKEDGTLVEQVESRSIALSLRPRYGSYRIRFDRTGSGSLRVGQKRIEQVTHSPRVLLCPLLRIRVCVCVCACTKKGREGDARAQYVSVHVRVYVST